MRKFYACKVCLDEAGKNIIMQRKKSTEARSTPFTAT